MCSVLKHCIKKVLSEGCDKFDQNLLDILLTPLLPSAQALNPFAYGCVCDVLEASFEWIQPSVSAFINHVLVGTELPGKVKTSRLANKLSFLIIEIQKIQPQFLRRVSPSLSVHLQAEEGDIDLKVVKSLEQFFSYDCINSDTEFRKDLREFFGRYNKLSTCRLAEDGDVNQMSSSHDDCNADNGEKSMNLSTKISDTTAASEGLLTSKIVASSIAVNVDEAINPCSDMQSPDCSFLDDNDNDGLRIGHDYHAGRNNTNYTADFCSPMPSLHTKSQRNKENRVVERTGQNKSKMNKKNLFQTSPVITR